MKISIQGFVGSFHHQVASELGLANVEEDLLQSENFELVFNDIIEGRATVGVVAIENSIAGAILENYDLLKKSGLKVLGEYYLPIQMQLLGTKSSKLQDIEEVRTHQMAFKQTKGYLNLHPNWRQVTHADTALAVEEIIEEKKDNIAGIAGKFAAKALGAKVLAENIEDVEHNFTRFLVVARHDNVKIPELKYSANGKTKTSIYIKTNHEPGALFQVLQVFNKLNLNMTMLVSRPLPNDPWQYGFYIDFEAEEFAEEALREQVAKLTDTLLVFGTYPAFKRK